MADGSLKRVDQIIKGDVVKGRLGEGNVVMCVIETLTEDSTLAMSPLPSGLVITPYHPIRVNGKWQFPATIASPSLMYTSQSQFPQHYKVTSFRRPCASIFSFALESGHTMFINGIECVTLGHNFTEPVVAHPYFGSHLVLNDLSRLPGFNVGHILLPPNPLLRDPASGLVCGLRTPTILTNTTVYSKVVVA